MGKKQGLLSRLLGRSDNKTAQKRVAGCADKMRFYVAGLFAYMDAFYEVAQRHRDFGLSDADFIAKHDNGRSVFEYRLKRGAEADLEFEPENPHDRNAIAVFIDGRKVGHVPADQTDEARRIMSGPYCVSAHVEGGAWKRVVGGRVQTDSSELKLHVELERA